MHHRLAGRPFALAADPRLLAEEIRHRRQLHASAPVRPEEVATLPARHARGGLRRLQRHDPAQGGGLCRGGREDGRPRAPSAPPTRCGSRATGCAPTTPTAPASCAICAPRCRGSTPADAAVAVLGAGGAARGVIHAMLEAGAPEVRVFNRTRDRADVVARHFGPRVKPYDWRDRVDRSREVGLLINATSLGMHGAAGLDMPLAQLADACVVADLVYVPLETPLLAAARARGLATVDGLGMLLHQATPGFEKWFGVAARGDRRAARPHRRRHRGPLMLVVGLTGSIGMGKSTVAARLRALGIGVCDADAEVHKLYEGAAVPLIEAAFPGTTARRQGRSPEAGRGAARQSCRLQAAGGHRPSPGVRGRARVPARRGGQGRAAGGARDPAAARERRRAPGRLRHRLQRAARSAARARACSGPA